MRFLLNIITFLICIIICVITIAAMPANNKQEDLIRTTPRPNESTKIVSTWTKI